MSCGRLTGEEAALSSQDEPPSDVEERTELRRALLNVQALYLELGEKIKFLTELQDKFFSKG